uniref:Uncharacterized protein n=1 Tax=Amphimedon queenslandica TaxID=400682 RepID=A0A1X7SM51_AMPQE
MRLKFEKTFITVGSIMLKNPQLPSINDIKSVLRFCNKALRPQLAQCKNIHEILELISDNSSFGDISLLEYLVNQFNIEEAKPVIKEYKEAVEEFKEMRLSRIFNEQFLHASERMIIVVDEDMNGLIYKDVQELLPDHVRAVNVIRYGRDGDSMLGVWKQKSSANSVGKTSQTT